MKETCHSEYLKLQSVFIKSAKDAFVSNIQLTEQSQELNYLSKPDFQESVYEYKLFEQCFIDAHIETHYFSYNDKVKIDSIYCRDASIATNFGMILCNMGKGGRINEPLAQMEDYKKQMVPIVAAVVQYISVCDFYGCLKEVVIK